MRRTYWSGLVLILLAWAGNAAAVIYKCTNPNGEITFSNQPCKDPGETQELKHYEHVNQIDSSGQMQTEEFNYLLSLLQRDQQEHLFSDTVQGFLNAELERVQGGWFVALSPEHKDQRRDALSRVLGEDNAATQQAAIAEIEAMYRALPPPAASVDPEHLPPASVGVAPPLPAVPGITPPPAASGETCQMLEKEMSFNPTTGETSYFGECSNTRQAVECVYVREGGVDGWDCVGAQQATPKPGRSFESSVSLACGCAE